MSIKDLEKRLINLEKQVMILADRQSNRDNTNESSINSSNSEIQVNKSNIESNTSDISTHRDALEVITEDFLPAIAEETSTLTTTIDLILTEIIPSITGDEE